MDALEVSAEDIELEYVSASGACPQGSSMQASTSRSPACSPASGANSWPAAASWSAPAPLPSLPSGERWSPLLENTLRLHRHPAGTLVKQSKYLHQRTGGMIGSLSHLIRAAAISAVLDGSERITKTSLRSIRIDHNSESDGPPDPPKTA